MSSEEMFYTLYDLTDDKPETIVVSNTYVCNFKRLQKKPNRIKQPDQFLSYFTNLTPDPCSCSAVMYADVSVHNLKNGRNCDGRLYMRICDDLDDESRYSFMLYLKDVENDKFWSSSISISASSIQFS